MDERRLRELMVRDQIERRGIHDPAVLEAMRLIPRSRFVPGAPLKEAYADKALPTRDEQTISQPYIVAKMTQLLAVRPGVKVLEIGTGSGYQTAILAAMGARVVSIERNASLAEAARRVLKEVLPGANPVIRVGDGTLGDPAEAPFDRVLVTAGAAETPPPLLAQLAEGGRMVMPIGPPGEQVLTLIEKRAGRLQESEHTPCRFVPLIGEHASE